MKLAKFFRHNFVQISYQPATSSSNSNSSAPTPCISDMASTFTNGTFTCTRTRDSSYVKKITVTATTASTSSTCARIHYTGSFRASQRRPSIRISTSSSSSQQQQPEQHPQSATGSTIATIKYNKINNKTKRKSAASIVIVSQLFLQLFIFILPRIFATPHTHKP